MKNLQDEVEHFDEKKSLQLINEMLHVSRRTLKQDGILMIVWGWIMTFKSIADYLLKTVDVSNKLLWHSKITIFIIAIGGLIYTIYYVVRRRRKVQTYIGISLRYVWVGMIVAIGLSESISFNVLHAVNYELRHSNYMILIAFAIVVTGGILRYKMIIFGGIFFALLALISSYLPMSIQLLLESTAWFFAFVIPGHILYSNRIK